MATTTSSVSLRPRIHYKKLSSSREEARFLEVEPANSVDDQFVCRLVTLPLREDLEFFAISTLLGDTTQTEKIVLDRAACPIPLHVAQGLRYARAVFYQAIRKQSAEDVTHNQKSRAEKRTPRWLASLLKHFGSSAAGGDEPKLRIWIDCICLNPNDPRENSKHKLIMYRIYQLAQTVTGWLGLEGPLTGPGIELIQAFDAAMPDTWQEPGDKELHPENYSPHHVWAKAVIHYFDASNDNAHGTVDFLARDFFNRRWMLEEIAMARVPTFQIGLQIVHWKQMLRLNLAIEEFKDYESNVCPASVRPLITEMPLGTIHELLDQFEKQKKREKLSSLKNKTFASGGSTTSGESKSGFVSWRT